jgi:hypothetical protein
MPVRFPGPLSVPMCGMTGTRACSQASKWSAIPAGKDERRSREVDSPTPKPHVPHTFQESEPFLERSRQFLCDGQITKGAAFDLGRAAIIIPPGSRTSRSIVSRADS